MFTDIVGYTALMGKDSAKALELVRISKDIQKPLVEKHNGQWVKEIGDRAMAKFGTALDAVNCAVEIQEVARGKLDGKLRIGIHQGEVVFEGEDVFGDGVNIASRLEPLAPIGGILVSESVNRDLGNKKGIETTFVREETLKNVNDPIKVYAVKVEGAEAPELASATAELPMAESIQQKSSNKRKPIAVVLGSLLILALGYIFYTNNQPLLESEEDKDVTEKSIAVLPFINMSNDPEQDYFTDGMTEDLLTQLYKIGDLRVISRTSIMQYKNTTKSIREIADELGVAHILEGSVRKYGDKVRISVQLIERVRRGS